MDYYAFLALLYTGMSLISLYYVTLRESLHSKVVVKVRAWDCFEDDEYKLKDVDGKLHPLYSDIKTDWNLYLSVLFIVFCPIIWLVELLHETGKDSYIIYIITVYLLSFFFPAIWWVVEGVNISISFGH